MCAKRKADDPLIPVSQPIPSPFDYWLEEYDRTSKQEGWLLTNDAQDRVAVNKLDDPLAVTKPNGEPLLDYTETRFDSDMEALAFVIKWAMTGSLVHSIRQKYILALLLVGRPIDSPCHLPDVYFQATRDADKRRVYRVSWEALVDAYTPEQAAMEALSMQRDSTSIGTVFNTVANSGWGPPMEPAVDVDVMDLDIPYNVFNRLCPKCKNTILPHAMWEQDHCIYCGEEWHKPADT